MRVKGDMQDALSVLPDEMRFGVMDIGRVHERQGAVMMLVVIPGEEDGCPVSGVIAAFEASREGGMVFYGFELRLGVRVVVGDVG